MRSAWTWWLPEISAALSVLFVLLSVLRIWRLRKETIKTGPGWLATAKIVLTMGLASLQLSSLIVLIRPPPLSIEGTLVPSAASAAASLFLICLSLIEHRRSVPPSDLSTIYLLVTGLLNAVWLAAPSTEASDRELRLARLELLAKAAVFAAESCSKADILLEKYRALPPEVKTGALGKAVFWWINPVLAEGYNNILLDHELPSIDHDISSPVLRNNIWKTWTDGQSKWLPLVLYRCLRAPFLSVIPSRLFLILFRYCQPFLIEYSIRFVGDLRLGQWEADEGFLIIVAAVVIYTGLAVSTAAYQHGLNRLQVMIRGALTGLIHGGSLATQSKAYDDGRVLTLVTTDTWTMLIELVIGILLLARQVGWLWPLPLAVIFLSSQTSRYVAQNLKGRSLRWNAATQKRITMTSAVIGSIKNIKMLGLQETTAAHISSLRDQELSAAGSFRLLMFFYNASANAVGLFTPVLTIVVFAVLAMRRGEPLQTTTAFPTISILLLITQPANMISTYVPRAIATYASFERIQDYLSVRAEDHRATSEEGSDLAISLKNFTVPSEQGGKKPLEDVSIDIPRRSVAILSGPVGAGKTVLARAILGEVAPAEGTIALATKKIAYCSQIPWLPGRSIKDVIHGLPDAGPTDESWYKTVVQACCLTEDLDLLLDGDQTIVGARGANLSGGQRQRVALARAIYQRCEIAILDDTFSGLDGKTEDQITKNLFGPAGLFRELGTTVLWITNSSMRRLSVLASYGIKEHGAWDALRSKTEQIAKLIHHDTDDSGELEAARKSLVPQPRPQATTDARNDLRRKNGDLSLYSTGYAIFNTFPQYWLKWWTDDAGDHIVLWTVGYFLLYFGAWVSTCGGMWTTTMRIAPKSGSVLHQRLVTTVTGATLYFFSTTDPGAILNRFGQDIQLVDRQLSTALGTLAAQTTKTIMQALFLFVVQPWLALSLPFCAGIVFVVQKVYLRTSRQLRVIELETKAAVYSSLLETEQGLETIRAFGWEQEAAEENVRALENSQRPYYLLFCLQRWLNIVLDLLVAGIAVLAISFAVALKGTTTGGEIGIALVVILSTNTTLLRLVASWTDLEISLGAIARLKSAETDIPREERPMDELVLATEWPSVGGVEFRDVTAAYSENAVALRSFTFTVKPGQTVVVCGRTGSGKSSLLLSLLRLLDVKSGSILVDGVDISRVYRETIRGRCFVTVTQDPFILPDATLRFNLDPSESISTEALIAVLEKVGLKSHFSTESGGTESSPTHEFLDKSLSALPTLSGGQAQLLSIARAVVHASVLSSPDAPGNIRYSDTVLKPIVLLDEITSSLDAGTEAAVYQIIQESFIDKGHTVIMVTHKLGTFMQNLRPGKDTVVFMKDGRLDRVEDPSHITVPTGARILPDDDLLSTS
ncbi:hypothetical protein GQ53DRAFT_709991 [Thozetella sp. PMI_491]|nr:hypothetical protein GQ53DRAFT_709991 [Thozetella sp. PMI_491]